MLDDSTIHIVSGGIGGTVGAILTCPLELIKVRFQSSQGGALSGYASLGSQSAVVGANSPVMRHHQSSGVTLGAPPSLKCDLSIASTLDSLSANRNQRATAAGQPFFLRSKIIRCLVDIYRSEGFRALFKGLLPTLVGVLPSRGIYFCAYHKGQTFLQPYFSDGHSAVFMLAAGCGSITASTLTNPIWYIKTRLQLDARPNSNAVTVAQIIRSTWRDYGIRGFYRGITASYAGSVETALNFVLYENIKGQLLLWGRIWRTVDSVEEDSQQFRGTQGGSKLGGATDTALCMCASAFSKAVAITACYPHEVARTRMRERGNKYQTFVGTLRTVFLEDGWRGLYRGLGTHYIRQVPNSCIMLGTYEFVVYFLQSWNPPTP